MEEYTVRAILNTQNRADEFTNHINESQQLSLSDESIVFATYSRDSRQLSSVFELESPLEAEELHEFLANFDGGLNEKEAIDVEFESLR